MNEELIERYNLIVNKLFSGEELTEIEVDMTIRFFAGGGTFPDLPDQERENIYYLKVENVHVGIKEMIKKTIAQSGRVRKNLEGWEME